MDILLWPFKALGRLLGFYTPPEPELHYRVVVKPLPGVSVKQLIATGKKLWPENKADIPYLINSWLGAVRRGEWFDAYDHFLLRLTEEEVKWVVKKCQETQHFKVIANEYEAMKDRARNEVEKAIRKKKEEEFLLEVINEEHANGGMQATFNQFSGGVV